jgi:hypothetical protein
MDHGPHLMARQYTALDFGTCEFFLQLHVVAAAAVLSTLLLHRAHTLFGQHAAAVARTKTNSDASPLHRSPIAWEKVRDDFQMARLV